jgi:hypothetical protein
MTEPMLIVFGVLAGHALAGKDRSSRLALAFGASFRNSALALLIVASMGACPIMTGSWRRSP